MCLDNYDYHEVYHPNHINLDRIWCSHTFIMSSPLHPIWLMGVGWKWSRHIIHQRQMTVTRAIKPESFHDVNFEIGVVPTLCFQSSQTLESEPRGSSNAYFINVQVHWLISSDLVQKQMFFSSLMTHNLVMIITYENIFTRSLPNYINLAPLEICVSHLRYSWWRHQMETVSAFFFTGPFWVVDSPHKDQWHRALMFSLIYFLANGWANNRGAGDLRRHRAY